VSLLVYVYACGCIFSFFSSFFLFLSHVLKWFEEFRLEDMRLDFAYFSCISFIFVVSVSWLLFFFFVFFVSKFGVV